MYFSFTFLVRASQSQFHLALQVLRERYQIGCLLGLTATASNKTAKSVIQHLGVPNEGSIIRDPNPIPENLQLTSSRDDRRDVVRKTINIL